jgi:cellulose synthase/poly-beta-1,6-N-acetylglucosamine synthase-like glycosyltransferase/peptidoglycan/xylan/chitin deacetylase (PgdA/CDA1 family)
MSRGSTKDARRPRIHWIVLGLLMLLLALALVAQGYLNHLAGVSDDAAVPSGAAGAVPTSVANGGPVVDTRDGTARTAKPPHGSIALTFDDGPDPRWTPEILATLRAHHAHATFFVVGSAAIEHPDLIRQILADGNEIGVHTLTHVNLGSAPAWRRQLEINGDQEVIAGITGRSSVLLRPPYSSGNTAVDDSMWRVMKSAGEDGYITVLSSLDSEDWQRPGTAEIVRTVTAPDANGRVVLMHDGGGDRSQTVAALNTALTRWADQDIRVTSVGSALSIHTMAAVPPLQRIAAGVLVWALQASDLIGALLVVALVVAGAVTVARAILVIAVASRHYRRAHVGRHAPRAAPVMPVTEPVSVIVPAYNEAPGIEAAVRSIAASRHPVEIIVVDDGSSDGTADIVDALAIPGVRVIRRENGGKPAALNTGIAASRHEIVVMVDGDTVFEPDTVSRLVQPFAKPEVGAVSGNTKVANRRGVLGAWQHIEYVVGFNLDRRLFDVAECMPTVPGAIGAFRRDALERIGGVSDDTLAEDTDLTMSLCRDGWRVVYQDDARAWTEAPASLGALWRQRYRWCYGTLQAMWKHRRAVLQGGAAGKLGRRGLLYLLLLQVLLPLFAPVVDLFALYGLVFLDPWRIAVVWLVFLAVQLAMAAYAFRMDRERLRPLWTLPLQQIVYRQLMYLVVIQSVFTAIAGIRLRWHRMERYGRLRVPTAAKTN